MGKSRGVSEFRVDRRRSAEAERERETRIRPGKKEVRASERAKRDGERAVVHTRRGSVPRVARTRRSKGRRGRLHLRAGEGRHGDSPRGHNKNTEAIKKAIEDGANVNEVEAAGNTPLHNCAYIGWVEGAELLLSLGAKVNAR